MDKWIYIWCIVITEAYSIAQNFDSRNFGGCGMVFNDQSAKVFLPKVFGQLSVKVLYHKGFVLYGISNPLRHMLFC